MLSEESSEAVPCAKEFLIGQLIERARCHGNLRQARALVPIATLAASNRVAIGSCMFL